MDCKKYIDERIGRLKNIMSEKGIDTVILKKPENVFYFSNFNPVLNSHPAVMIISLDDTSTHARRERSRMSKYTANGGRMFRLQYILSTR